MIVHGNAALWDKVAGAIFASNLLKLEESIEKGGLQVHDWNGETALQLAARLNNIKCLLYLLAKDTNVNASDNLGDTALHKAAAAGHSEAVRVLLCSKRKLYINKRNSVGCTPLHLAVNGGHSHAVSVLLDHGASIDLLDTAGRTPVHLAVEQGFDDILEMLRNYSASHQKGGSQISPRDVVRSRETFVREFCERVHVAIERYDEDLAEALLRSPKVDLDFQNVQGETFLIGCARRNLLRTALLLLLNGAKVDIKDSAGNTALHWAAHESSHDMTELLLRYGAGTSEKNSLLETPLHVAVRQRGYAVVRSLLSKGASTRATDMWGWTPVTLAQEANDVVLTNLFQVCLDVDPLGARASTSTVPSGPPKMSSISSGTVTPRKPSADVLARMPASVRSSFENYLESANRRGVPVPCPSTGSSTTGLVSELADSTDTPSTSMKGGVGLSLTPPRPRIVGNSPASISTKSRGRARPRAPISETNPCCAREAFVSWISCGGACQAKKESKTSAYNTLGYPVWKDVKQDPKSAIEMANKAVVRGPGFAGDLDDGDGELFWKSQRRVNKATRPAHVRRKQAPTSPATAIISRQPSKSEAVDIAASASQPVPSSDQPQASAPNPTSAPPDPSDVTIQPETDNVTIQTENDDVTIQPQTDIGLLVPSNADRPREVSPHDVHRLEPSLEASATPSLDPPLPQTPSANQNAASVAPESGMTLPAIHGEEVGPSRDGLDPSAEVSPRPEGSRDRDDLHPNTLRIVSERPASTEPARLPAPKASPEAASESSCEPPRVDQLVHQGTFMALEPSPEASPAPDRSPEPTAAPHLRSQLNVQLQVQEHTISEQSAERSRERSAAEADAPDVQGSPQQPVTSPVAPDTPAMSLPAGERVTSRTPGSDLDSDGEPSAFHDADQGHESP